MGRRVAGNPFSGVDVNFRQKARGGKRAFQQKAIGGKCVFMRKLKYPGEGEWLKTRFPFEYHIPGAKRVAENAFSCGR